MMSSARCVRHSKGAVTAARDEHIPQRIKTFPIAPDSNESLSCTAVSVCVRISQDDEEIGCLSVFCTMLLFVVELVVVDNLPDGGDFKEIK